MVKSIYFHREMPYLVPVSETSHQWMIIIKGLLLGDDDATDPQCQIGSVPNVFQGNILNHVSH